MSLVSISSTVAVLSCSKNQDGVRPPTTGTTVSPPQCNIWTMLISDGKAALFHHDAQQRALAACVGASIALHALVLFSFPGLR